MLLHEVLLKHWQVSRYREIKALQKIFRQRVPCCWTVLTGSGWFPTVVTFNSKNEYISSAETQNLKKYSLILPLDNGSVFAAEIVSQCYCFCWGEKLSSFAN